MYSGEVMVVTLFFGKELNTVLFVLVKPFAASTFSGIPKPGVGLGLV